MAEVWVRVASGGVRWGRDADVSMEGGAGTEPPKIICILAL